MRNQTLFVGMQCEFLSTHQVLTSAQKDTKVGWCEGSARRKEHFKHCGLVSRPYIPIVPAHSSSCSRALDIRLL
jgi:hypothetical protein